MRTVFTIELKCDINSNDDERRKAFIDLLTQLRRATVRRGVDDGGQNAANYHRVASVARG